jgi:hypothetical protein
VASEQARYQPRFRVVTRKPLVKAPPIRVSPVHRASLLAILPALCMLFYVLFWTLAIRGGYYRDQLQSRIREARMERSSLEAEKRGLQSPGYVLERAAKQLGMRPAERRQYARSPVAQQVAQRSGQRTER